MPPEIQLSANLADQLASRISEALIRERVIPRFVDSYVIDNGRHALQVHASLYRDLLAILQREALLAACAHALDMACTDRTSPLKGKSRITPRKGAPAFRRRFLSALSRDQRWTAGDALEFQSDLLMYEELLARQGSPRRMRKPFEAANHPFVDRCAFMLDSSFLEKARLAASRALTAIETLAAAVTEQTLEKRGAR